MKTEVIFLPGARHLDIDSTCPSKQGFFGNNEVQFELGCSVRHKQVILVQSFPNVNDNLMELMLAIDASKKAGASYITTILLTFPYARQERKHKAGVPISAKIVCDMLAINADRVITFNLHALSIQGFMNPRVIFDHIDLTSFMVHQIKKELIADLPDWVAVSPDTGAIKLAKEFADQAGMKDIAVIDKTRTKASVVDKVSLIGDVANRNCIIVDDMCGSGGTLKAVANELSDKGAYDVVSACIHPVFTDPVYRNIETETLRCLNTLPPFESVNDPLPEGLKIYKIEPLIESLIDRVTRGHNISPLYNWEG